MRNKPLFKSTLCIPLLMLVCTLLPQRAVGQPAVDYAHALLGTSPSSGISVIRAVAGGTMAIASKNMPSDVTFYLIDPLSSTPIYKADIAHLLVHDMRVIGTSVYFCGSYYGRACIGSFDYSYMLSPAPPNIPLTLLDNTIPGYSCLYRMVVYQNGSEQKVVAVGNCIYDHSEGSTLTFPDCWDTPNVSNVTCIRRLVVEADYPSMNIRYICSEESANNDFMDEVVETNNYVAIIGLFRDNGGISIHKCNKSNVLDSYCYDWNIFPFNTTECSSHIKSCRMDNDTIAIVSMAPNTYIGATSYLSSIVRVFDLATMTNTSAQLVATELKDEPKDIIYVPSTNSLILLHNIYYPLLSSTYNSFITIDPYPTTNYAAPCWYLSSEYEFNSLDMATANQFISSGGSYWNIKDATTINANSGCYKNEVVSVKLIDCIIKKPNNCNPYPFPHYEIVPVSFAPQPMTFGQICITP